MKRPEGFDRPEAPEGKARPSARPPVGKQAATRPQGTLPKTTLSAPTAPSKPIAHPDSGAVDRSAAEPADHSADRELKKATRRRRHYERGEVRRFTRRSRRRKIGWLVTLILVALVGILVTAAVYSPLLSLKTIRIEGASRVNAQSVHSAVDNQVGRPLALVDFGAISSSLSKFPLIRSYVTETVPPDTLVIRISERAPIASIATSSGFSVVDPAGIVIDTGATRQPGLPLVDIGDAKKSGPGFAAAVGVLLSLPPQLLAQVDTATAQTGDDVTLTLTGGKTVVWGSPEQSAFKAKVLADLVKIGGPATKYDVSAPNHPVVGS